MMNRPAPDDDDNDNDAVGKGIASVETSTGGKHVGLPSSSMAETATAAASSSSSLSSSKTTTDTQQVEYIEDIRPQDVLLGRGAGPNEHPGNVAFRMMVKQHKKRYVKTNNRKVKNTIAHEVITFIRKNRGRFLEKATGPQGGELYVEAHSRIVLEKTKQALRHVDRGSINAGVSGSNPADDPNAMSDSCTKEGNLMAEALALATSDGGKGITPTNLPLHMQNLASQSIHKVPSPKTQLFTNASITAALSQPGQPALPPQALQFGSTASNAVGLRKSSLEDITHSRMLQAEILARQRQQLLQQQQHTMQGREENQVHQLQHPKRDQEQSQHPKHHEPQGQQAQLHAQIRALLLNQQANVSPGSSGLDSVQRLLESTERIRQIDALLMNSLNPSQQPNAQSHATVPTSSVAAATPTMPAAAAAASAQPRQDAVSALVTSASMQMALRLGILSLSAAAGNGHGTPLAQSAATGTATTATALQTPNTNPASTSNSATAASLLRQAQALGTSNPLAQVGGVPGALSLAHGVVHSPTPATSTSTPGLALGLPPAPASTQATDMPGATSHSTQDGEQARQDLLERLRRIRDA